MKEIIINRKFEFNNRLRAFKIYLNDDYCGLLQPNEKGKIIKFESIKDIDYIQLKVDWCSSNKLEIPFLEGEVDNYFEVSSSIPNKLLILILSCFILSLLAFLFFGIKLFGAIAIGILLIPLYKVTLDRSNYLKVKRIG